MRSGAVRNLQDMLPEPRIEVSADRYFPFIKQFGPVGVNGIQVSGLVMLFSGPGHAGFVLTATIL